MSKKKTSKDKTPGQAAVTQPIQNYKDKAKNLSRIIMQRQDIVNAKKKHNEKVNGEIAALDEKIAKLATEVIDGVEQQDLPLG